MIYSNSSLGRFIHWERHPNPDGAEIAKRFLAGERELLRLAQARTSTLDTLTLFLQKADSIEVKRGTSGELLLTCHDSDEQLLLTGKAAFVLRSYLDDEPVSMRDRLDMTQRRRLRG